MASKKRNNIDPEEVCRTKKKTDFKKQQYTDKDIEAALTDVKNGMSKKKASQIHGVPRQTIQFRLSSKFVKSERGPSPILTKGEEDILVNWIFENQRKGFPRRKEDIQASVKEFLLLNERDNPFKDNLPGDGWYRAFLKRHPEISKRESEGVTLASSCVSEKDIKGWFFQVSNTLLKEGCVDILKDPTRVYNGDETNFMLCPKNSKVLAKKGSKNIYEIDQGQAKSNLTVMFTFSASGDTVPPMVIYPYQRIPLNIQESVPEDWGIGRSDNGWMKGEVFFEYISNVFSEHLTNKNIKRPVILFVDGHKTHLTLHNSEICSQLGIVLIALYPNATRILQPADVSAFKPLKDGWKKGVLEWRRKNPNQVLTKEKFAPILKSVLELHVNPETLKNGFKACGLYPWNPSAIDYSKCLATVHKHSTATETIETIVENHDHAHTKCITLQDFTKIVGSKMTEKIELYTKQDLKSLTEEENTLLKIYMNLKEDDGNKIIAPSTSETDISDVIYIDELNIDIAEGNNFEIDLDLSVLNIDVNKTTSQPTDNSSELYLPRPITDTNTNHSSSQILEKPSTSKCVTSPLVNVLHWPESPKRKGKRNIERTPYVVTCRDWKFMSRVKLEKQIEEQNLKEKRKIEREVQRSKKKQENEEKKRKVKKTKGTVAHFQEYKTAKAKICLNFPVDVQLRTCFLCKCKCSISDECDSIECAICDNICHKKCFQSHKGVESCSSENYQCPACATLESDDSLGEELYSLTKPNL